MILVNCGCGAKYSIAPEWVNIDFNSKDKNVKKVNILKGLPFEDGSVDVVFSSCMLEHFTREQGQNHIKECYRVLKPNGILRIVVPDLENICREYLDMLEKVRVDDSYEKQYEYILIELVDQMTRTRGGGEMLHYWEDADADIEYVKFRTGFPEDYVIPKDDSTHGLSRWSRIKQDIISRVRLLKVIEGGRYALRGELHKWMYDSHNLSKLMQENGFFNISVTRFNESNIDNWVEYGLEVNGDGTEYKPNCLYVEGKKGSEVGIL